MDYHATRLWDPRAQAPWAPFDMFMYLGKKHFAPVPRATKAQADRKADGSYEGLHDAHLKLLNVR
jgi:hypothetical protein